MALTRDCVVWILGRSGNSEALDSIKGEHGLSGYLALRVEVEEAYWTYGSLPKEFPDDPYYSPQGAKALGPVMFFKDWSPLERLSPLHRNKNVLAQDDISIVELNPADVRRAALKE